MTKSRKDQVGIGSAARLFGLAPSTLRWWEDTGALGSPPRQGERRRYGPTELRRIGLAYLFTTAGRMSLKDTAVLAAGRSHRTQWQQMVRAQLATIDQDIERLKAGRQLLEHMLSCQHDDIAQCPYLEAELIRHTPRGRVPAEDIVTAAHNAGAPDRHDSTTSKARPQRSRAAEHHTYEPTTHDDAIGLCRRCGRAYHHLTKGRRRTYCSTACRQAAYRQRQINDTL